MHIPSLSETFRASSAIAMLPLQACEAVGKAAVRHPLIGGVAFGVAFGIAAYVKRETITDWTNKLNPWGTRPTVTQDFPPAAPILGPDETLSQALYDQQMARICAQMAQAAAEIRKEAASAASIEPLMPEAAQS